MAVVIDVHSTYIFSKINKELSRFCGGDKKGKSQMFSCLFVKVSDLIALKQAVPKSPFSHTESIWISAKLFWLISKKCINRCPTPPKIPMVETWAQQIGVISFYFCAELGGGAAFPAATELSVFAVLSAVPMCAVLVRRIRSQGPARHGCLCRKVFPSASCLCNSRVLEIRVVMNLLMEMNRLIPGINQLVSVCQQSCLVETEHFASCLTELKWWWCLCRSDKYGSTCHRGFSGV